VSPNIAKHPASFRATQKYIFERTGIQVDAACKDPARLCFMSYDPEVYVNRHAIELEPVPEPDKPQRTPSNGQCQPDLSSRERIAAELLGTPTWSAEKDGYFCQCPGKSLHTTLTARSHTILYLDGVPTIKCQHNSCARNVKTSNHELRSLIAKAEYRTGAQPKESDNGEDAIIARLAALP
jgi:hypothetical protein